MERPGPFFLHLHPGPVCPVPRLHVIKTEDGSGPIRCITSFFKTYLGSIFEKLEAEREV